MRKRLLSLVGIAVVALGPIMAAGQASADENGVQLEQEVLPDFDWQNPFGSPETHWICLAVDGGGNVGLNWCDNAQAIRWDVEGDGTIRPAGDHSKCLDSLDNGHVYLNRCNGGNYQAWWRRSGGVGWFIQDDATKKCLDGDKRSEYAYTTSPCSASNGRQNWSFRHN